MNAKYILAILAILIPIHAHAQADNKTILLNGLAILSECQANYKIAAYYTDIYQSYKLDMEKVEKNDSADQLKERLISDWNKAEDLILKMKNALIGMSAYPPDASAKLYEIAQVKILEDIVNSVPAKTHIQKVFKRTSECSQSVKKLDSQVNQR